VRWIAKSFYFTTVAIWLFAVLVVTAKPAYAYVDPGSGIFALQVIGSTVLGFAFLIRSRIQQFFERFKRTSKGVNTEIGPR
jgi:hypothetical protein